MSATRVPKPLRSGDPLPRPVTLLHRRTAWAMGLAGGWFVLLVLGDLVRGWIVRGGAPTARLFLWADLAGAVWAGVVAATHWLVVRRLLSGRGAWVAPLFSLAHLALVAFVLWWSWAMGSIYGPLAWTVAGIGLTALATATGFGLVLLTDHLRRR